MRNIRRYPRHHPSDGRRGTDPSRNIPRRQVQDHSSSAYRPARPTMRNNAHDDRPPCTCDALPSPIACRIRPYGRIAGRSSSHSSYPRYVHRCCRCPSHKQDLRRSPNRICSDLRKFHTRPVTRAYRWRPGHIRTVRTWTRPMSCWYRLHLSYQLFHSQIRMRFSPETRPFNAPALRSVAVKACPSKSVSST